MDVELSVVIACLNAADTLGEQLTALAEQDCPVRWELLICDNGSTDGTAELVAQTVRRYGDRLPAVMVDASERAGAGAARNVGARHARGRWLAFCDADDVVAADWLAQMVAALQQNDFVGGRFDGTRLNSPRALRSRSLDQQEGLQSSPGIIDLPHAGAGNMGVRRDLFLDTGGFDPQIRCLEDTDLSWRVQLQQHVCLHYAPEAVVHVRLRSARAHMYRQGFAYGAAYAFLEDRYGSRTTHDHQVTASVVASSDGRGIRALLTAWLGQRPSVERVIWQYGWHRGYHRRLAELRDSRGYGEVAVVPRAVDTGAVPAASIVPAVEPPARPPSGRVTGPAVEPITAPVRLMPARLLREGEESPRRSERRAENGRTPNRIEAHRDRC